MSNKDTKGYGPRVWIYDTWIHHPKWEKSPVFQDRSKMVPGVACTEFVPLAEFEDAMEEARKDMTLSGDRIAFLEAALKEKDERIEELEKSLGDAHEALGQQEHTFRSQLERAKGTLKWEYLVVGLELAYGGMRQLEEKGKEGWELVAVTESGDSRTAYFKREL